MIYKNSIKVLFSNFNIVWKLALYLLLVFAFGGTLFFFCMNPIVKFISEAGFFRQIVELYTEFLSSLNLASALERLSQIFTNLGLFIKDNISQIWVYIVLASVVLFFLNNLLFNLSHMAVSYSLHFYIGSLTRQGFFESFGDCIGKNLKTQFCNFFVSMPINILYIYLFIVASRLFDITWFLNIFAVIIIVVGFVILMAFKYTLLSAWIPSMVVMNHGVCKSFGVGLKITFRRFGHVFRNAIGIILTIIVLNMFLGMFTFMVGLIISIPISVVLYNAFGMVVTYEGQGMRYYVDIYNVITPKKKEDLDKIKDMKFVV